MLPAQPPSPLQRDFSPPVLDVLTVAVLGALPRVKALLQAPELTQLKGQGIEMETCPKKEEFPGVGSG